jgi:tripeptidyl-peptidase-1
VPDYQAGAVNSFLSANKFPFPSYNVTAGNHVGAHGGVFNVAGRGIPDVSANGALVDSYVNGLFRRASGTSFSTPIWASIINLVDQGSICTTKRALTRIQINEERIAIGKGPVGFINPVLYQHIEVFNDIKNGSNPGCHSEGFHAVDGYVELSFNTLAINILTCLCSWDPLTGLGTPKYPLLEQLFLSLP